METNNGNKPGDIPDANVITAIYNQTTCSCTNSKCLLLFLKIFMNKNIIKFKILFLPKTAQICLFLFVILIFVSI